LYGVRNTREKRADIGRELNPTIGLHFPVYSVRIQATEGSGPRLVFSSVALDEIC
jgi:hypothetical protein